MFEGQRATYPRENPPFSVLACGGDYVEPLCPSLEKYSAETVEIESDGSRPSLCGFLFAGIRLDTFQYRR